MNSSGPVQIPPGLVERAKAIIMKPRDEWPVIAGEDASIGGLYTRYALWLAAIPALAVFVRAIVFGYGSWFGVSFRPSIGSAVGMALGQYVTALASVAVVALIVDFLAPRFDGTPDRVAAFKLAIYSATAGWLAGIFSAVPGLEILGLLGLYSFYLFYLGAPVLMKVPEDKVILFTVVVVVIALIVGAVLSAVAGPGSALFRPAVTIPGPDGSITFSG